jgi:hypothetical protein
MFPDVEIAAADINDDPVDGQGGDGFQVGTDDLSTDASGTGVEAAPEEFSTAPKFAAVDVFEDLLGAAHGDDAGPHFLDLSSQRGSSSALLRDATVSFRASDRSGAP